ncbi:MAG: glycoside hydrolase family 47 protein [Bacteroidota bacterium]|nr:glycoside hydrolase family 47 protein [Bacteroidota bacterium]
MKKHIFFFLVCNFFLLPQKTPAQIAPRIFTKAMKYEMREKVKQAVKHAWQGYKQYAWGFDDLKPLTKTGHNWYKQSLLMTPVDAFDTFILLGLKDEAREAKDIILQKLNFNVDQDVQVFEITIRLLAGLLTAYELDGNKKFLSLADDLGKRLMPCFNTPTGMPYRYVNLVSGKIKDSANNPAEIGTLIMEFGKLSKLTHNTTFYNAAKKAIMAVYSKRSGIDLVGETINVNTGDWLQTQSHVSGYIDSYYEYLFKCWKLFGDKDFKNAWNVSAKAIKKYLVVKQNNGWFCTHADMNTGIEATPLYGALDAFIAGLMAYSGDIKTGGEMQKANYYMWTKFNMEPEEFNFKTDSILSAQYVLRPENLESCFYLYRLTKDQQYLFMGKRMVDDILTHCRTDIGFASLKNVRTFEKSNSMHSFLFAETFKYAYLIFAPDNAIDLNKVVLTTEAHPLKITSK